MQNLDKNKAVATILRSQHKPIIFGYNNNENTM